VLVEHDTCGAGDHRAPAAAHRGTQVDDGVPDFGGDRIVRSLLLEPFTQCAPVEVGLGTVAVGVFPVSEIHRGEGSRCIK
jgi:hypothetical protein